MCWGEVVIQRVDSDIYISLTLFIDLSELFENDIEFSGTLQIEASAFITDRKQTFISVCWSCIHRLNVETMIVGITNW